MNYPEMKTADFAAWYEAYKRKALPRTCSTYHGRDKCPNDARYVLHCDGVPSPGGDVCTECGIQIVTELNKHDDRRWTLMEFDRALALLATRKT